MVQVTDSETRATQEIDEDDVVPLSTLRTLRANPHILSSLSNHHLRTMLQGIDSAQDPVKELKAAMLIPIFLEFADSCLDACGVNILEPKCKH